MKKTTALELSSVLKAYAEGKYLQKRVYDGWTDVTKLTLSEVNEAIRSWEKKDVFLTLRIKPEKKLVPFGFEDNLMFRDKYIILKEVYGGCGYLNKIVNINHSDIRYVNCVGKIVGVYYEDLLKKYEFEDGSPCGKYVEE